MAKMSIVSRIIVRHANWQVSNCYFSADSLALLRDLAMLPAEEVALAAGADSSDRSHATDIRDGSRTLVAIEALEA